MNIGYARVLSCGQNLDIQLKPLQDAGCEKIYSEKVSGTKEHRNEYEAMLEFAREGNQIVLTKLDRLSRSLFEFQQCSQTLEKKIDHGRLNKILTPLALLEYFCSTLDVLQSLDISKSIAIPVQVNR